MSTVSTSVKFSKLNSVVSLESFSVSSFVVVSYNVLDSLGIIVKSPPSIGSNAFLTNSD
nr:MAG TPA: hypothetical protein [Crassvirales sp.]